MTTCRICGAGAELFLSFGRMPIANGFLTAEQFATEPFFELDVAFCPACTMVQLTSLVDPQKLFHENYAFYSSTSRRMAEHFGELAQSVMKERLPDPDPFVVEMGSNDGILLHHFAQAGIRHLGIEPSANVAKVAMERGVHTISRFFNEQTAREILEEHGPADVFLGANVMCHIPDLHGVAKGVHRLLKPRGVMIFEDPYLGDILEKTSYDQIYDEHAYYFSVSSVSRLFERHDMEVTDVLPQHVHGGSMRYVIAKKGAHQPSERVKAQRVKEESLGLHRIESFHAMRTRIADSKERLLALLRDLKKQGKRVVGYGATSKSTTVINYCGITPELVEFISDTTPIKQGKYSPGMHIPVRPYVEFAAKHPDHALLFAWNHAEEIMAKEAGFRKAGGRWIVYVPRVEILS